MKKHLGLKLLGTFVLISVLAVGVLAVAKDDKGATDDIIRTMAMGKCGDEKAVILGYVTSWSTEVPDPYSVTHLAYAFATIDDDFCSLTIKNEGRFEEIVDLKNKNPELKVLLSIGGWGAGNFSEMASTAETRAGFIHNAMDMVRRYGIDGLDIDWEYPGSSLAKISSSKEDKSNFSKLMKQLRDSLGGSRCLSFASPSYSVYFDYDKVVPYVDFVNIMTYDMSVPPSHHSPLNHSELTGKKSVKDVVAEHYSKGVPADKMLLGIPFYGRGNQTDYKKFQDFRHIRPKAGTEWKFDSIAVAPYISDKETGELLISFDDTTSIMAKCKFVKEVGLRGVMVWHYCGDTKDRRLLNTINSGLN